MTDIEIDRLDAETKKLVAEARKLDAEQWKLAAQRKLEAEERKLQRDRDLSIWQIVLASVIAGAGFLALAITLAKLV